jgi:predicted nucleic acid-binding Zn ribbon protein
LYLFGAYVTTIRCAHRRESFAVDDRSSAKIGDILPRVLSLMGLDKKLEEAKFMKGWAGVVGPVVASRSRPRDIRDGILYVGVESSVWMHELWFHREEILDRIGKEYPGIDVKGIRLEIERENP